jgi:hypothetical protein
LSALGSQTPPPAIPATFPVIVQYASVADASKKLCKYSPPPFSPAMFSERVLLEIESRPLEPMFE